MVKVIHINTMDEFFGMVGDQPFIDDIGRYRSFYVYRGMTNVDYHLETALHRNCGELAYELEPKILRNFRKYAIADDPTIMESVWEMLFLGQHHMLPTRLLDWTHSSLIAANFATLEDDMEDMDRHDCVIWRVDMRDLNSILPPKYQEECRRAGVDVFSYDMLADICRGLEEYDSDMQGRAMVMIEPPSIDPRIVNQYAFFSIVPKGLGDIESFLDKELSSTVRYVISKDIRWEIRDMLDSLNISERLLYPGLEGISRWLARHYYVNEAVRRGRRGSEAGGR